jgi:hypothetical protein
MTIVASVKVRDGLILGTDSMTQISAPTPEGGVTVLKAYSNARKLFQVGDIPIGVMTYGLGNLGNRSIEGLVLDFSRNAEPGSVENVSRGLYDYVKEQYDNVFEGVADEQRPVLGSTSPVTRRARLFPRSSSSSCRAILSPSERAMWRRSGRVGAGSTRRSCGSTRGSTPTSSLRAWPRRA